MSLKQESPVIIFDLTGEYQGVADLFVFDSS